MKGRHSYRLFYLGLCTVSILHAMSARALPEFTQVFEGTLDGDYSFIYSGGQSESSPALGDTDGDGDLDLAVAGWNGVAFYRNDGTSRWPVWTFIGTNVLTELTASDHLARAAMCDIDADGDDDLFVAPWQSGKVMFFRSQGNHFTLVTDSFVTLPPTEHICLEFADLNEDGTFDLLVGTDGVVCYLNTGTPEVPNMQSIGYLPNVGGTGTGLSLVNLDNDSKPDLILGGWARVYRYKNVTTDPQAPSFELEDSDFLNIGALSHYQPVPETGDLDGDGDADLFFGEMSTGARTGMFGYFENRLNLPSKDWALRNNPVAQFSRISSPSTYDIDNDGDLDLFAGEIDNNATVKFFENVGSPTAAVWRSRSEDVLNSALTGNVVMSPEVCDIDNDGVAEMLVARDGLTSSQVYLVENTGTVKAPVWDTAHITVVPNVWSAGRHPALDTGDLDKDGYVDIVMSGQQGGSAIVWYRNISAGGPLAFTLNGTLCDGYAPSNAADICRPTLSDADRDGDLDLFVASDRIDFYNSSAFINYFENRDGVFNAMPDIVNIAPRMLMGASAYITAADLNGDGRDDVLCSDWSSGLTHYRQRGETLLLNPPAVTLVPGESVVFQVSDAAGNPVPQADMVWSVPRNRSLGSLAPGAETNATATFTAGSAVGGTDIVQITSSVTGGAIGRAYVNVVATEATDTDRVIIFAGGSAAADGLWSSRDTVSRRAYEVCRLKGIERDCISYLSDDTARDIDGNTLPDDIDAVASSNALMATIAAVPAGTLRLTVYIVAPGSGASGLEGASGDTFSADDLASWLNNQLAASNCRVTVIIDCSSARPFLEALAPPAGKERIVLTSTDTGQDAFFGDDGRQSFSAAFWGGIFSGLTVGEAFQKAFVSWVAVETPLMDDTGDGIFERGVDGDLAAETHVGLANIAGPEPPQVGANSGNETIETGSDSLPLWVDDVISGASAASEEVFAVILPPDAPQNVSKRSIAAVPSYTGAVNVPLTQNPETQRYEGTFSGFDQPGDYKILFYAKDPWNSLSVPKLIHVRKQVPPDSDHDGLPDSREDANANGIVDVGETDPHKPDTDADGLNDGVEAAYDGDSQTYNPYDPVFNPNGTDLNATRPDTDGDGVQDGTEIATGHDPLDPRDIPSVPTQTNRGVALFLLLVLTVGVTAVMRRHFCRPTPNNGEPT